MTFSPLISGTLPYYNKCNPRQGTPVVRVIQHHHAAFTDAGVNRLTDPNAQASANYVILSDGRILGHVPEEFRAWTSGGFEIDANAITIEIQNSSGKINDNDDDPGSWKVSDAAYSSLVRLIADVAKRHAFGAISNNNYIGHRQVGQTACPGGYLWSKMAATRNAANALLSNGGAVKPTASTPPVKGKTVWQLADETIAGLHGSGEARKASLGSNYNAVQAEVNRRLGAKQPVAVVKSISQLADETLNGVYGNGDARIKALGGKYAAVQAEINRRLGAGANKGPNISQLADAVLRGQYGSGDDRKRRLGANYAAVQAEVNRRLG